MINLFKSFFISVYASYTVIVTALAAFKLINSPDPGWLGVAIGHAAAALLFLRLMILRDQPRMHPMLPVTTVVSLIGGIVAILGASTETLPKLFGGIGLGGYFVYLLWYSRFARPDNAALTPGNSLPSFEAVDASGDSFSSIELIGAPAVLLFYRGNWCPLCMAQIKEIASAYRDLAQRGIAVVLISPQPQSHSQRLAKNVDAPMRFIVDQDNRIARDLGIAWQHGVPAGMQLLGYDSESVLPTVIVTDARGRIVLADQTDNYRVRPEPDTFIAALEQAQ